MRIRTLKPEWMEDERMALASDAARVASVCLILLADDQGRGRFVPQMLASRIFAANPSSFAAALGELSDMRFLLLYEVDGQRYWQIRNWNKHQRVDNAAKPRIPAPLDDVQGTLADFRGEIPGLAAVRGLTPTPTPTLIPTPTKTPRARKTPTSKTTERLNAEGVISEHRRMLKEIRGLTPSELITDAAATAGNKILNNWPDRWLEVLEVFVRTDDKWLKQNRWPLGALIRFADRYDTAQLNTNNSGAKSVQQIQSEAAEYDAMLERRMLEAEAV